MWSKVIQNEEEQRMPFILKQEKERELEGSNSSLAKFIGGLQCGYLGGTSFFASDCTREMLNDITAVCRRCFKRKEVALYVALDNDYERGLVFTDHAIVYWTDGRGETVEKIKYEDIDSVDYNEDGVLVDHGDMTQIYLGDDADAEEDSRHLYTLIMDILDYLAEEGDFAGAESDEAEA